MENILPKSKKELTVEFGISYRTLKIWLEPIKLKIGEYKAGKYTPKQLKIIAQHLDFELK